MHLVGARFGTPESALAALREVRGAVAVAPGDVGMRPLGSTAYDQPVEGLLVAGRFEAPDVAVVVEILERHGGTILARRREHQPYRPPAGTGSSGIQHAPRPVARRHEAAAARTRLRRPATPLRVRAARDRHLRPS